MDTLDIEKLDENTIKLIKAGTIFISPRSIIKELIENSLDAQASEIIIELDNGGYDKICIEDNGHGILESDSNNLCLRNYTSKIDGNTNKYTKGFRGEALACLSVIADIEIISYNKIDNIGWTCKYINGEPTNKKLTNSCVGTTVICSNIFYNYEARKQVKIKKVKLELVSIIKLVQEFSLINYSTSWTIYNKSERQKILEIQQHTNIIDRLNVIYPNAHISKDVIKDEQTYMWGTINRAILANTNEYINVFIINKTLRSWKKLRNIIQQNLECYQSGLNKIKYFTLIDIDINEELLDCNIDAGKMQVIIKDEAFLINDIVDYLKSLFLYNQNISRTNKRQLGRIEKTVKETKAKISNSQSIYNEHNTLYNALLYNKGINLLELTYIGSYDLVNFFVGHHCAILCFDLSEYVDPILLILLKTIKFKNKIDATKLLQTYSIKNKYIEIIDGKLIKLPFLYYEVDIKIFLRCLLNVKNKFDIDMNLFCLEYIKELHKNNKERGLDSILWDHMCIYMFNNTNIKLKYSISPCIIDILKEFERC